MSLRKQIFKLNILQKLLAEENSCVTLVPTTRLLALPPFFLNDMKSGIFYLLNSFLKKYDRTLDGIVIGYQNIKVLMDDNTGIIPMGTAETEVNVSVEFYIFQPKIGNYLEGVINKKSNNHIGCLVHCYFNATILKPEDVEYEDWMCRDFNVNDKIIFKVKNLDFTGLLPYIEGTLSEESSLYKRDKVSDNVFFNDLNKEQISSADAVAADDKHKKGKVHKGEITLDDNVTEEMLWNNDSDVKGKKKKREKEKKLYGSIRNEKEMEMLKSLNLAKITSSIINKNSVDESYLNKEECEKVVAAVKIPSNTEAPSGCVVKKIEDSHFKKKKKKKDKEKTITVNKNSETKLEEAIRSSNEREVSNSVDKEPKDKSRSKKKKEMEKKLVVDEKDKGKPEVVTSLTHKEVLSGSINKILEENHKKKKEKEKTDLVDMKHEKEVDVLSSSIAKVVSNSGNKEQKGKSRSKKKKEMEKLLVDQKGEKKLEVVTSPTEKEVLSGDSNKNLDNHLKKKKKEKEKKPSFSIGSEKKIDVVKIVSNSDVREPKSNSHLNKKQENEKKLLVNAVGGKEQGMKISSNQIEVPLGSIIRDTKGDSHLKKKKGKKKEDENVPAEVKILEDVASSLNSSDKILSKLGIWDDDSKDFVKPEKQKKKKKDKEGSILNKKETERLSLVEEDNVFFSTQLEPSSGPKKLGMSFLSPIRAEPTAEEEEDRKQLLNSLMHSIEDEINGKKKKHKKSDKKRKRDEDKDRESSSSSKKLRTTPSSTKRSKVEAGVEVNGGAISEQEEKSRVQSKLNSFQTEGTDGARSESIVAGSEGTRQEMDQESIYQKLMEDAISAISVNGGKKKSKRNKAEGEVKPRKRKAGEREEPPPAKKFRNGSMYDLDTPEKRNPDKSLFSDSEKSPTPGKRRKEVNGGAPDDSGGEVKKSKSLVQSLLDDFLRKEKTRLKSESDRSDKESGKEAGKKRKGDRGSKSPATDDLYAKLLKEAKQGINFEPREKKGGEDVRKNGMPHVKSLF